MRDLYIVGAGGFGRELLGWLRQHPDCGRLWRPCGFLDDNPAALDWFGVDLKVLDAIQGHAPLADAFYVCALGQPAVKERMIGLLRERGARFLSFVHPTAVVGERVALGEGAVLCPGVVLTTDITVGEFTLFNCASSAGHDCRIGAFSTICGHVDLTSRTVLEPAVFVGSHAVLVPGVRIGRGAVVGAGAVVLSRVRAGETVFGNPARNLRA